MADIVGGAIDTATTAAGQAAVYSVAAPIHGFEAVFKKHVPEFISDVGVGTIGLGLTGGLMAYTENYVRAGLSFAGAGLWYYLYKEVNVTDDVKKALEDAGKAIAEGYDKAVGEIDKAVTTIIPFADEDKGLTGEGKKVDNPIHHAGGVKEEEKARKKDDHWSNHPLVQGMKPSYSPVFEGAGREDHEFATTPSFAPIATGHQAGGQQGGAAKLYQGGDIGTRIGGENFTMDSPGDAIHDSQHHMPNPRAWQPIQHQPKFPSPPSFNFGW